MQTECFTHGALGARLDAWEPGTAGDGVGVVGEQQGAAGGGGVGAPAWPPSGFPGAGWGSRQRPPPSQAGGKGELTLWPGESKRVGE